MQIIKTIHFLPFHLLMSIFTIFYCELAELIVGNPGGHLWIRFLQVCALIFTCILSHFSFSVFVVWCVFGEVLQNLGRGSQRGFQAWSHAQPWKFWMGRHQSTLLFEKQKRRMLQTKNVKISFKVSGSNGLSFNRMANGSFNYGFCREISG